MIRFALLFILAALWIFPDGAQACATCFGQSDSPMTKGMAMGILTLLAVVSSVLLGFCSFVVFLVRRNRTLAAGSSSAAGITSPESGRLPL